MGATKTLQKIDPTLRSQLNAVAADDEHVEAVVRLCPDRPGEIVPSPERTQELAIRIIRRVGKRVGNPSTRHNIFSNLGSFVISAPRHFLRELIQQPEVAAVVANRQTGEALIPPIDKKPLVEDLPRKKSTRKAHSRKKTTEHSTRLAKARRKAR